MADKIIKYCKDGVTPKKSGGKQPNSGRKKVLNKKKVMWVMVKDADQEKQVNELKLKLKR
jgi:hypothetical protein